MLAASRSCSGTRVVRRMLQHPRSLATTASGSSRDAARPPPSTKWFWRSLSIGCVLTGIYAMGKPSDPGDTPGILAYGPRAWTRLRSFFTSLEGPAFEKLLPDQVLDPTHPRPYTLVIDLDKFLVCHTWDREQGRWRIAKRPGADLFLFYAAQLYELVVFSSLPQHEGDMIVKGMDRFGCITHALYRFATTHKRGRYLKDIGRLNRDPAKVLVLGHDIDGFSPHPENFLAMPSWTGDPEDASLEHAVDFLEQLAFSRLADIRPAIGEQQAGQAVHAALFPESYDRAQEEAYERARAHRLQLQSTRSSSWIFRLLFGGVATTASALRSDEPTYAERKLQRLQARRKEYAHIKDLMQKQLEAEMAKEKAYYADHKMSLWDLFTRAPPANIAELSPSAAKRSGDDKTEQ